MRLTPKNWSSFQHYKDRAPVWIKLHRSLLDDFAYSRLPVASRALAPLLWLLASEYSDGVIDASPDELAFRLRMKEGDLVAALNPLIDSGFFDSDSDVLASRKQDACLEKRREETEEEKNIRAVAKATRPDPEFDEFKKAYPKRKGANPWLPAKKIFDAERAKGVEVSRIIAALRAGVGFDREKIGTEYIPQAVKWLRDRRWEDLQSQVPEALKAPIEPDENALRFFKQVGRWHRDYGPEPGQRGCRVPAELLAAYGYSVSRETGEAA